MIGMSVAVRIKKMVWEFSTTAEFSRIEEPAELEVVDLTSTSTVGFQPNDD